MDCSIAIAHIVDAERGRRATPHPAYLVQHSLLPRSAPHLKELIEARQQQQPGRSAADPNEMMCVLCAAAGGIVTAAGTTVYSRFLKGWGRCSG